MTKLELKIFKNGNSQAITLNKEILYKSGLNIGDVLDCEIELGKLVLERKEIPTYKELIREFYRSGGSYNESEILKDEPKGKELW